jgi:hypothetical protein
LIFVELGDRYLMWGDGRSGFVGDEGAIAVLIMREKAIAV